MWVIESPGGGIRIKTVSIAHRALQSLGDGQSPSRGAAGKGAALVTLTKVLPSIAARVKHDVNPRYHGVRETSAKCHWGLGAGGRFGNSLEYQ